jgi:hypothetical protein
MNKVTLMDDISAKISQLFATVGAHGFEERLKELLKQSFSKMELVTADEFEIHKQVLQRTRLKLEELEKRVAELEAQKHP